MWREWNEEEALSFWSEGVLKYSIEELWIEKKIVKVLRSGEARREMLKYSSLVLSMTKVVLLYPVFLE